MHGTITITKGVDHNDEDAAYFDAGYTWELTDDLGTFSGAKPSRKEAIDEATDVAVSHGCVVRDPQNEDAADVPMVTID